MIQNIIMIQYTENVKKIENTTEDQILKATIIVGFRTKDSFYFYYVGSTETFGF